MRSSLVYPGMGIDIDLAIMKNKILGVGTGLDLEFPEGHTEEFQSYITVNGDHIIFISPSFGKNIQFHILHWHFFLPMLYKYCSVVS